MSTSIIPFLPRLLWYSATPLTSCLLSIVLFFVSTQFKWLTRLIIAPFLLGGALVSLMSSGRLAWLNGADNLWALLMCGWILHAFCVLYVEYEEPRATMNTGTPKTSKLYMAYKLFNDPRGIGRPDSSRPRLPLFERASTSTGKLIFFATRMLKISALLSVHAMVVGPTIASSFSFQASDFAPDKELYFRRLILQTAKLTQTSSPITWHETRIRALMAVNWIWIAFVMIEVCHCMFAALFVTLLRLDEPAEWPPLFGSVRKAYSVRRFWSKFWHRLPVRSCLCSLGVINDSLPSRYRFMPRSRAYKTMSAFWVFLVSGICHMLADWVCGVPISSAALGMVYVQRHLYHFLPQLTDAHPDSSCLTS